ncbi:BTAD domain-containing putative transcriptional regulator [Virgisporangium ochraceum]|uniref:SARP family transcriptional regulator n=1 Tax=Virgisporangium ochraceum TaxID=65505 RepID=A0A8J4EB15_9ACTN|nr:BTAD domain-containing putative transcriptional regulator [Virgisporangium ochraceum]GIJ68905.1 SARP family transcriptional regulator [Virgisporangium ochraceum]
MWYGVLGPTQVRTDCTAEGDPVPLGGTGLRALLGMLVVDAGHVVGADRLIDGLYGENPPAGAANALQSQVSRLRRALGGTGAIELHPAGYRLTADPDDTDLHRFERLASAGRRALSRGDHVSAARDLAAALELWRGTPFADTGPAPFAAAQAARLEDMWLGAVEDRADAELALGHAAACAAELAPLVAGHPLRERLRGLLMRALAGSGRSAEALASYEEARELLADRLGTDPSPGLSAVHVAVLRGETDAAPLRTPAPAQLTSFVGREGELGRVADLVKVARLVTLIGPGGAGKTRLAVEVASRASGEMCFVELAPVVDGADVPRAVLGALGLREAGLLASPDRTGPARTGAIDRIATALAGRDLLLVVDNCEHVIDDVARLLARLLGACPGLRVLATSREALGITGETLSPVPPLALPPTDAAATDAAASAAIMLFADRAAAVLPGFRLDADTLEPVVRICRALDGLPLAIELAAARLRSLPVAEVAARLDDRFRLLSRGSRTAAARHRTLRAVVEWSWDLLDDDERTLARRLTVFAGGATLAAAAEVCQVDDVVDLLTSLADKSLVEPVDGGRRYRMLETVRAFGAEQLALAGEAQRFRAAHAHYFLDVVEAAGPHLMRAEQLDWLRRLDDEYDNLHGALRQALQDREVHLGLRLISALTPYWWLRGVRGAGAGLAMELLAMLPDELVPGLEEEYALCVLHAASGPPSRDLRVHLKVVDAFMAGLEAMPQRPFLNVMWAVNSGPPIDDADYILALSRRWQRLTDPWLRALMHLGLGYIKWYAGDADGAGREFEAGIAELRTIGERWGLATMLSASADLADARGDLARAAALTDEAMAVAAQLDAPAEVADLLCRRADRRIAAGDLEAARADYEQASRLAHRSGAAELFAATDAGLAVLARLGGELDRARSLLDAALENCPTEGFGPSATRTMILVELGRVAEARDLPDEAEAWYRRALDNSLRQLSPYTAADAVYALAELSLRRGDAETAATLVGTAHLLSIGVGLARPAPAELANRVREAAGPAFESAFSRGRQMDHDALRAFVSR